MGARAGTGLGEAGLFWDATARRHRAFASEGGHCDFSPRDERQIALLRWLREKYPNASWERVLSGPGLRNIYDFLITPQQMGKGAGLPSENPKPREIAEAAMRGARRHSAAAAPAAAPVTVAAPAAVEAQNMFTAFYGAEAANLALKVMATGGVYISGGIALGMVEQLKSSIFLDAFRATGPESIRQVLRKIPIHIVNFELNGLYGAANYARHL